MNNQDNTGFSFVVREYIHRLRAFRPNARYYLLSVLITGATMGVFRLLASFYVLSLGFDEAVLGRLITTSNLSALLLALPMGYVVESLGKKTALIARSIILTASIAVISLWPSLGIFYAMNAMFGLAQSLSAVAMGPFLMENSGEQERHYLFSFGMGLQMASMFAGNWICGFLPTWVADWRGVDATHSLAYSGALTLIALMGVAALVPLSFIRSPNQTKSDRHEFTPLLVVKENPKLLGKVFAPLLLVSLGAGFFVPFMNIFFRQVHNQPDPVVGSLMAWGSLAMGVGLVLAPPLVDRVGKIRLVVITQGLSIPFMALLGFTPVFAVSAGAYYMRMALMNMSNPIYQNFALEQVDERSRSTVASLYSMIWSLGRSITPSISGSFQVAYGFGPPFMFAISLYAMAIPLYWLFFLRSAKKHLSATSPGD